LEDRNEVGILLANQKVLVFGQTRKVIQQMANGDLPRIRGKLRTKLGERIIESISPLRL
jgi:hypothetical protein